jgi:hypothetical protein
MKEITDFQIRPERVEDVSIPPMTIMVASNGPSRRASDGSMFSTFAF